MKRKKVWILSATVKLNKPEIENFFQPLIDSFKRMYVSKNPDKRSNYTVDVYTKWRGNYLYFCEKCKTEQTDVIKQEFEANFIRLECLNSDCFNLSYFRHTGKWFTVAENLTLTKVLEMIEGNRNFHPIG